MSVAIVVADGLEGKGGIERMMAYLVDGLNDRFPEIKITILKTRSGTKPWFHMTTPFYLFLFVVRLMLRRINLVHINVAPRGSTFRKIIFARVARALGRRVILHLHGSGYDVFFASLSETNRRKVRKLFQDANRVIVLGEHWATFARNELRLPATKIAIVANGVPEPKDISDPTHSVPRIVFMGQLGPRKGVDILLAALARMHADGIKFAALIGGNGDIEHYRAVATEAGISHLITFLGWIDGETVQKTMLASDIFVLPSRAENQPVAILEAMACGLPVVASAIGAIPEQVIDGETGILVPSGDIEALKEALSSLANNPKQRELMGMASRRRWKNLYSIHASVKAIADLYGEALMVQCRVAA